MEKPRYERPAVLTIDASRLTEAFGPAQAASSGTGTASELNTMPMNDGGSSLRRR